MNSTTMQSAIKLGQLFTLLSPITGKYKELHSRTSRLRSGIGRQIVIASKTNEAAEQVQAQKCIQMVYDALLEAVQNSLVEDVLVAGVTVKQPFKDVKFSRTGTAIADCLLGKAEQVCEALRVKTTSVVTDEGALLHTYASVIRNSPWFGLLADLGYSPSRATRFHQEFSMSYGSGQGRAKLESNLAAFSNVVLSSKVKVSKKRIAVPGPVLIGDDYSVQVTIDVDKLLARPTVAELVNVGFAGDEPAPTLADIMQAVAQPVAISRAEFQSATLFAEVAARAAQKQVDVFVGSLKQRSAAAKAARAEQEKVRMATQEAKAKAALKGLDPKLLEALKRNPELLQQV